MKETDATQPDPGEMHQSALPLIPPPLHYTHFKINAYL